MVVAIPAAPPGTPAVKTMELKSLTADWPKEDRKSSLSWFPWHQVVGFVGACEGEHMTIVFNIEIG